MSKDIIQMISNIQDNQTTLYYLQVVMYRKYRVGELPDIQIKHSELIVPLQALAQLDSKLAQQLFSILCRAVMGQLPEKFSDDIVSKAHVDIQEALNMMMDASNLHHPPFVYAIENTCFQEKQLKLEPQAISYSSILSVQQPVGILLLEKQLMNMDLDVEPRRKKLKSNNPEKPEDTRSWLELGKIYKSIGDYDSLRSIFSCQIAKLDITRKALSAEARNDFKEALDLYRKVWNTF